MNPRLLRFIAVIIVLPAILLAPQMGWAQQVSLFPDQVPNGIASLAGEAYHQRMEITLTGAPSVSGKALTITVPGEFSVVTGSVTATSQTATVSWFSTKTVPGSQQMAFGLSGTGLTGQTMIIEFDLTTATNFAGISDGTAQDTSYTLDWSADANQTDGSITVSKHQNFPIRAFSFSAPDSVQGDTTVAGGRFYKMAFPSALLDLSHRSLSGLSIGTAQETEPTNPNSDVLYTFYLSTDSTLIQRPLSLGPVSFFSQLKDVSAGNISTDLLGTRQVPTFIPSTYIREDFVDEFSSDAADSVAGVISLAGTANNTVYYIYALADPAPDRFPQNNNSGSTKHGFDPTVLGDFSGGVFLARSGPLLVLHPPEFVVAGWDYDNDGGDDFDNTGVVQVPSDVIALASTAGNLKDNANITVDSGDFFSQQTDGTATPLPSFNSGFIPDATSTTDLLFLPQDADDPGNFSMNIFLSTTSGLGVGNLVGGGIDSLSGSIKLSGTDTLTIAHRKFEFDPVVRDAANLVSSFVPEATYFVYFAATDGVGRTVSQVFNDPFIGTPVAAQLTVKHSPNLTPDLWALNDFDASPAVDGDLDVVTGIDVSQMIADTDGKDLNPGPAQRFVSVSWGEQGLGGDIDIDNDATIEIYYATRSDFNDVRGSVEFTSGNSDGSDLLAVIAEGNSDVHLIGSVSEDPDGQFANQLQWDLWTYVSPEGTIPRTGVDYFLYALMRTTSQNRLVSLTLENPALGSAGSVEMAVEFLHPPYVRVIEPSRDLTVTVDEPVMISWEAFDVDNQDASGLTAVPTGTSGRISPNSRTASNNVRILLTSVDWGEVTTWGSVTDFSDDGAAFDGTLDRLWVGNSGDGSLNEEIELNEGVDTSFVIIGNRMRLNLFQNITGITADAAASTGFLELQTKGGVGQTYFVYVAMDDGRDGTVADAVAGGVSGTVNFGNRSPLVRAPGRITFTGVVPTNPPTTSRFIVPTRMVAVTDEVIQFPIVAEASPSGKDIHVVDIFMTVDADKWEAVDVDPSTAGIQPFTRGEGIPAAFAGNISQVALTFGNSLRLDFLYSDPAATSPLSGLDGQLPIAFANLKAKSLTASTVSTTISLDNSGTRITKMLDSLFVDVSAFVPQPTSVTINARSQVSGTVPLQGRSNSADSVTFVLREVGSFSAISDALFELQDINPDQFGVQVQTTDFDGKFTLTNVPSGRFILTAFVPRHLVGHDTLNVEPGLDLSALLPTRDGEGVQRTALVAGDAAGFSDSTGTSKPDNQIGDPDINAINAALFTQPGEANFNTFADINRDNIVNATDKDFATANRTSQLILAGTNKIKPVFPVFKQALPEGDNAEAMVTLANLPEGEVKAGEAFDVTVELTGAKAVRTYEVHLQYDPSKLAFESLTSNGSLLENYLTDMSGRILKGEIGLVNSIIGRTPVGASGDGTLATVRFRTLSRSTEARLTLSDAMLIDVEHAGHKPKFEGEVTVVISDDPIVYHDAKGSEIRGLILPDVDSKVDFNDFLIVAKCFGTNAGDPVFDIRADLNGDDQVNFADFLIFTQDFGRVAIDAPASRRLVKAASAPGVNRDAELSLNVDGKARIGKVITLSADLSQAEAVQGWGLTVRYDADRYEFVEAKSPEGDMLTSSGATAPLFLVHQEGPDQITLASAIGEGQAASGEGSLAVLTFRPKTGEFEDARFEIFEGVLFDSDHLTNPIHMNEALEVRLVPAEFALSQNYPNPFNPETTISYDLAEGSEVRLEIYNVMGQLVNTLVSEAQAAGRYRMRWSGQDAFGRQVASGVYFYRLQTEGFKAVRKLMLLK